MEMLVPYQAYNLSIKRQSGDGGSHYATWEFNEMTDITVTTGTGITIGSLVTIKSGATYYNGTHIPNWVMADQWYVSSMSGDRVVLGRNPIITLGGFIAVIMKFIQPINDLRIVIQKLNDTIDALKEDNLSQNKRIEKHGVQIDDLNNRVGRIETKIDMHQE